MIWRSVTNRNGCGKRRPGGQILRYSRSNYFGGAEVDDVLWTLGQGGRSSVGDWRAGYRDNGLRELEAGPRVCVWG
jgi:hypothetical protein